MLCWIFLVVTVSNVHGADGGLPPDFLAGEYLLIGRGLENGKLYSGRLVLELEEAGLLVKRMVGGITTIGMGRIEKADLAETEVLRIRFTENSINYEETCLIATDLDNHARISCYLYRPGIYTRAPGLEAFFAVKKN